MTHIDFSVKEVKSLAAAFLEAKKKKEKTFKWNTQEFVTDYARYLLSYLHYYFNLAPQPELELDKPVFPAGESSATPQ